MLTLDKDEVMAMALNDIINPITVTPYVAIHLWNNLCRVKDIVPQ